MNLFDSLVYVKASLVGVEKTQVPSTVSAHTRVGNAPEMTSDDTE